jgi:hypothetical protein
MAGGKLISTGVEFPDATTQTTSGLPLTGGALTGAVTTTSTFDGRDVAADGVTADAALPKAGGTMTGTIAGFTSTGIDDNATSTAITIDASENVGIGTVVPGADLEVSGTIAAEPTIRINNTGSGGWAVGDPIGKLQFYTTDPSANGARELASVRAVASQGGTTPDGSLEFWTTPYNNTTPRLSMSLNGVSNNTTLAGNLVMASGKGIDFSADGNAGGMTSEVLDDYEEGTFTPTIQTSSTGATFTYNTQYGTYRKIGNQVLIQFAIDITVTAAGSGLAAVQTSSLPFTPKSETTIIETVGGFSTSHPTGATATKLGFNNVNPASSQVIYWRDVLGGAGGATTGLQTGIYAGHVFYNT